MPAATTSKKASESGGTTKELESWIDQIVDGKDG